MTTKIQSLASAAVRLPFVVMLGWVAYRRFRSGGASSSIASLPLSAIRIIAIFAMLAVLVGCSDADPLPVATGPLYQLNPANWHATQQDLSGPPQVANN